VALLLLICAAAAPLAPPLATPPPLLCNCISVLLSIILPRRALSMWAPNQQPKGLTLEVP
jgi:hypothetical protein